MKAKGDYIMKERLISAGVGVVICVAILLLGEWNSIVIEIAIALVTGLMCGELLAAKGLHKNIKIAAPCVLFGALIPLLICTKVGMLPLYLFMVSLFVIMVVFHNEIKPDDVMFAYGGTLLLSLSMASLVIVSCTSRYPSFYLILALGVPWLSDSGAYFTGVYLGKTKLCPEISPKKTVEGAIGGLISGCIGAVLIGFVFMWIYGDVDINFWGVIIVGLLNPVISIFGDLSFSVIKRSCGIKDYGSIMPGHGGALDRFDSIIFCAPLVFVVSQFIRIIA